VPCASAVAEARVVRRLPSISSLISDRGYSTIFIDVAKRFFIMTSLISHFQNCGNNNAVIFMPVSRLKIEDEPIYFDRFIFFPLDYLPIEKLRVIPNNPRNLREFTTLVTGITLDVFLKNTTIAFATNIDWRRFYRQDHKEDTKLISSLSEHAEKFMDVIRFTNATWIYLKRCPEE
jgi:hypothetical protein